MDQAQNSHTQVQEREIRHVRRRMRTSDSIQVHTKKRKTNGGQSNGGNNNREVEFSSDKQNDGEQE